MAKQKKTEVEIIQNSIDLRMHELEACILGVTPFVCNSMPNKAKQTLLYPSGRKTQAEKATSMKHPVMDEYRDSFYRNANDAAPTLFEMVAVSFKRAIESVALDVPGATKAQILRNIVAPQQKTSLYGVPQLFMAVVRTPDMNRTPDIRTRAIIPEWACRVTLRYPHPMFREKVVADYLALAGQLRGVGDYRPQQGPGSYGLFEIVNPDDPRFLSVIENGRRAAQIAAVKSPEMYDDDTRNLYEWFSKEMERRGAGSGEAQPKTKGNGVGAAQVQA